jgi:predicted permease
MSSVLFSVLGIYIFIAVGFVAKMSFKEKIDDKTITLLSVYFLQIFLTFWGLLKRPIDASLILAPSIYLIIVALMLGVSALVARRLFSDAKERSIATVAAVIGNTGNLGIPLGIALFGEQSIPYTTLINLVNVFVVYTVGVYAYSRGEFNVKASLLNILKLPILWAATLAIILNLAHYTPAPVIEKTLQMGAYASIVLQLVLFGIYLYGTKIHVINRTLIGWVVGVKFILLPLLAYLILGFFEIDAMVKSVLFLELIVPLAIANVNFASLYECRPKDVTALVFVTSLLFLAIIFIAIEIMKTF